MRLFDKTNISGAFFKYMHVFKIEVNTGNQCKIFRRYWKRFNSGDDYYFQNIFFYW